MVIRLVLFLRRRFSEKRKRKRIVRDDVHEKCVMKKFLLCETRVKFSPFYENNQRTLFINERHYY